MSDFEIPAKALDELAAAAVPLESTDKMARKPRVTISGYAGFVCYSCRCKVDENLSPIEGDEHKPGCEWQHWYDEHGQGVVNLER